MKNWIERRKQSFLKTINNRFERDSPSKILYSLSTKDFLVPWSNCVVSIEKSPDKLDSTFSCLFLFLQDHAGPFYQERINGIVRERESETNRYYRCFQLLFFVNLSFRRTQNGIFVATRNDSKQRSNCEHTVADYFGGLWEPEFPPK